METECNKNVGWTKNSNLSFHPWAEATRMKAFFLIKSGIGNNESLAL